jgi:hypothetical protein
VPDRLAPRDCEPDAGPKTFSDNAIGNILTKSAERR